MYQAIFNGVAPDQRASGYYRRFFCTWHGLKTRRAGQRRIKQSTVNQVLECDTNAQYRMTDG
jgi:hypothetical protein